MTKTTDSIRSEIAAVDRDISDLQRRKTELLIALRVVESLDGQPDRARHGGPELSAEEKKVLVLELLDFGDANGRTPASVHAGFQERGIFTVNADNIRTILWRMGQKGEIGANRGRYWKLPQNMGGG